jgi:hypothetical protein
MQRLFAATSLCLVLATAGAAQAQAPRSRSNEESTSQTPETRMTIAQQNFYERASMMAHERTMRMEARKWQGISPLRPNTHVITANDLTLGRGPWDRLRISPVSGILTARCLAAYPAPISLNKLRWRPSLLRNSAVRTCRRAYFDL